MLFFSNAGDTFEQKDLTFGHQLGEFFLNYHCRVGIGLDVAHAFEGLDFIDSTGKF